MSDNKRLKQVTIESIEDGANGYIGRAASLYTALTGEIIIVCNSDKILGELFNKLTKGEVEIDKDLIEDVLVVGLNSVEWEDK